MKPSTLVSLFIACVLLSVVIPATWQLFGQTPNTQRGIYQNQLRGFPREGVFVTNAQGQVRQANIGEGLQLDFTNPSDPVLRSPLPPPQTPTVAEPPTATVISVTQPESSYPLPPLVKFCLAFRNGVLMANGVHYTLASSTLTLLPDSQGDNSTKPGDVLQFVCW